jgi:transposase
LLAWLQAEHCTIVAMESTGVYWRPVFNILEDHLQVIVVNPTHMHQVPGRKTDVNDAMWIADLLRHGLLHASFIPPLAQREVRELTRHRTILLQDRARFANRLERILEDTTIKLSSVVSDLLGVSARAMLTALLAGQPDPVVLARLARGRLRDKREALEEALVGIIKPHQRFLLVECLGALDFFDDAIARVDEEIAQRLRPYEADLARLDSIPGVGRRTAEIILAEVGISIDRFPSARHLAAWAGIAPGNHESAGKRIKGRIRYGNHWLRHALIEAGHAAAKSKHTYLAAQYGRLRARRGGKKAVVAVGHSILVIAYHLLRRGQYYRDLGATYFDQRDRQAVERRLIKRLETLGYTVELQPSTEQREEAAREAARRAAEFDLAKKRLPLTWQPGQSVPRDRGPSG